MTDPTRRGIRTWFQRGVDAGARYMLVVCDQFDYGDFPVYADSAEEARTRVAEYRDKPMHRVHEVYDLTADMGEQVRAAHTYRLPEA